MIPNELAVELGISPKTLRAYLRTQYGKLSERSESHWLLSTNQVEQARLHFGRPTSGALRTHPVFEREVAATTVSDSQAVRESNREWADLFSIPRVISADLERGQIPTNPGVYLWFRDGECIYVGIAGNLRQRFSNHRSQKNDMSGSTLRSWVAVELLGMERELTRLRPSIITEDQTAQVNAWVAQCEVAWVVLNSRDDASFLEAKLLRTMRPRFNAQ